MCQVDFQDLWRKTEDLKTGDLSPHRLQPFPGDGGEVGGRGLLDLRCMRCFSDAGLK